MIDAMLDGRRTVVTGGSSGIGRQIVRTYAALGASVISVGRSPQRLDETAVGLPGVTSVVADLTDDTGRRAVAEAVGAGPLDLVVHAAGALGPADTALEDYPSDAWYEVFEVNVSAVHFLHRLLAPALRLADRPTVIGVSSSVGRQGRAGWGMYAVSKFALEGWLEVLAGEWGDRGRVYSVNPGGTATPMRASAMPDEDPATIPQPADIMPIFVRLARADCAEPSGSRFDARDWIGYASSSDGAVPSP